MSKQASRRALSSWLLAGSLKPEALLGLAALCLASCRPLTPADHTRNLRVELEVVRLGCAAYILKRENPAAPKVHPAAPKVPGEFTREPVLDRDCPSLLAPTNGGVSP